MEHSLHFLCLLCLWLCLQSDLSTVQGQLNPFSVTSLSVAIWTTEQTGFLPGSWVYAMRYVFVQKLALERVQTEPSCPMAMFFVGSFNAKLTSRDERFREERNFSSHTHISYWEGQTIETHEHPSSIIPLHCKTDTEDFSLIPSVWAVHGSKQGQGIYRRWAGRENRVHIPANCFALIVPLQSSLTLSSVLRKSLGSVCELQA